MWLNFCKILDNADISTVNKKTDQWLPGAGARGLQRGRRKVWKVIDVFIILIMVMITWAYTYVSAHIVHLNYVLFIVVNYTSIKQKNIFMRVICKTF